MQTASQTTTVLNPAAEPGLTDDDCVGDSEGGGLSLGLVSARCPSLNHTCTIDVLALPSLPHYNGAGSFNIQVSNSLLASR